MPTYTHNNYYGYINKIQERAISNPEWFWSESDDALQVREWLRNNGAQAIIDDIYKNTPDEMKRRIPAKMLNKTTRENIVVDRQRERTNAAAKNVAMMGAAIAGVPASVSYAAAAPIATGISMLTGATGGFTGSILGKAIGRHIFTNDVEHGIPTVHSNGDKGEEWGGLIGGFLGGAAGAKYGQGLETKMLKNYGYANGESFSDMIHNFKNSLKKDPSFSIGGEYEGWYRPAETFTSTQRTEGMNRHSYWLDNIQRAKSIWDSGQQVDRKMYAFGPRVRWYGTNPLEVNECFDYPTADGFRRLSINTRFLSDQARSAIRFNKAYDAANSVLNAYNHEFGPTPYVVLDPNKLMTSSSNMPSLKRNIFGGREPSTIDIGVLDLYDNPSGIGVLDDASYGKSGQNILEIIGHEVAHDNEIYNNRAAISNAVKPDNSKYYGNDYSNVPNWIKVLLQPIEGVNPHDSELSESFSDLFGLRTSMKLKGFGNKGKFNRFDLWRYNRIYPKGVRSRFLVQHPGTRRQLDALNTITGHETN